MKFCGAAPFLSRTNSGATLFIFLLGQTNSVELHLFSGAQILEPPFLWGQTNSRTPPSLDQKKHILLLDWVTKFKSLRRAVPLGTISMKTISKVVLIKLSGFGASPKQADWLDSVLGTTRSDGWTLDKIFEIYLF